MEDKRERVEAALRFASPDRPPVVGGFVRHPSFLAEEAGVSVDEFWRNPRSIAIKAFRRLQVDMVVGLILPDPSSKAMAQVDHRHNQPYGSPEEVKEHALSIPGASEIKRRFDAAQIEAEYRGIVSKGQDQCGDAVWIPNGVGRSCANFDFCGRYGYENYVMALTLYPDAMKRLFDAESERARLTNCVVARVNKDLGQVPCVWTGSDACDNRGPFVDPAIMRDIYFPTLARSLDPLDAVGRRGVRRGAGRTGQRRLLRPELEMTEDLLDHALVVDQGDQLHFSAAMAADEGIDLPDLPRSASQSGSST